MIRGKFITLEGIEGAGKTTVARSLTTWLRSKGVHLKVTREPGGTPLAERVRDVVLKPIDEKMSSLAETLLFFAARSIHLENLIRPALGRGDWIVCDRFTDATRAYQGAGRGVDRELIEHLAREVHRGITPDRTIILDLPVALGLERVKLRGEAADRFDEERHYFFEKVRSSYLEIARAEPQRVRVIDASRSLENVEMQLYAAVADLIE
jgi:dTMP kinase